MVCQLLHQLHLVIISLTGATFANNGDYIYTVEETGSTDNTTYPKDTTNKYTIKIFVRNASATDFSSKVVTVQLYSGVGASATKLADNASFTFTSAAVTRTITINNTVQGNMADTDKYFDMAVTISGNPGDSFAITGQTGSGDSSCTVASGATSCTANISLKHNETATISGVKTGTTYSFSEVVPDGYQGSINGATATTGTINSGNKTVGVTNTNTIVNSSDSQVPTGMILKVLPYVIIVALAVAAIVFVVVKNNKKKEEVEVK